VTTDEDAITAVLVRYATGIDQRDWDLFRTCFTEDVHAEYDGIDTWTSADAITEFMVQAHLGFGPTMHQLSNIVISVDGDRATARTYVHGVLTTADRQSGLHAFGIYDDELVRNPEGWRISRRRFASVDTRSA
jgi:3-phenylpropionate/cinnamic acid dioxygenase small subunit